jgi:DnaJ-class molecular chaperone
VTIPAGAKTGTRVRLKGKGEAGRNGGPPGDVFVVVEVEPSPLFERRGSDLILEVPVTFSEAALGASVEIPTPDGPVALKLPAGTESGKLLRVKGRGAPHVKGGGRGDLLARVKVSVPKKLSKAEKEALEGYQKVSRENPRERFVEAS